MLSAQLQREVAELAKERDRLVDSLHQLAAESMSKIYVLEEEKSDMERAKGKLEAKLRGLESELAAAKMEIAELKAKGRLTGGF